MIFLLCLGLVAVGIYGVLAKTNVVKIVLGLLTTKRGALEPVDDLRRRIDEAAKHVPLDQLCLSPQCGFSSNAIGNLITVDDEVAKLRRVVEVAEAVWS